MKLNLAKRLSENQPYGKLREVISENLFKVHPYKGTVIGKMEHLDSATEEDYKNFNKKYHIPNNAVLVVAGDIEIDKTLSLIKKYFDEIPRGNEVVRNFEKEEPIVETKRVQAYDENIQIPAYVYAYRTPAQNQRDSWVLNMISTYLSDGESSKLYKKIVDEKKMALTAQAANAAMEDYGMYFIVCLALTLFDIFIDSTGSNWWYFVVGGWGIGLFSHFIGITSNSLFSVEKEVERLKNDSKDRY